MWRVVRALAGLAALAWVSGAGAVDGLMVELGAGANRNHQDTEADLGRLSVRWEWPRQWFAADGIFVAGQWEAGAGYMRSTEAGARTEDVFELGADAVLRVYPKGRDAGLIPYAEAGLGVQRLSDNRLGTRLLSTHWHFSTTLGLGLRFGARGQYEAGYRFWHLSNADTDRPNPGLDFHVLRFGYLFR